MVLSDLRHGIIVYIPGVDPDILENPPYNMVYECTVINWTATTAKMELTCNGKSISRTFGELIDRLPENVEQVDIGVWRRLS